MDSSSLAAEKEVREFWPSPNMKHLWTGEEGVRACHVQFVPQRVLLAPTGEIIQWWDGSHGNVVDGKHGQSRGNSSTHLADTIAAVLEKYPEEQRY